MRAPLGPGDAGMTLLEVVIALVLLGFTALLLSEGVGLGARVWDRGGERLERAWSRLDAAQTLRRLVETAEPPGPLDYGATFRGEPQRLGFLTIESARLARGAPRLVEVGRDAGSGEVLLRLVDPVQGAPDEVVPLFVGTRTLDFRYRGRVGNGSTWVDRWGDGLALPEVVELAVTFADGTAPLTLTIPLQRRLSAECLVAGLERCAAMGR